MPLPQEGDDWRASADDDSWRTLTVPNVAVNLGNEIVVVVQRQGEECVKLDYVQLDYRGTNATTGSCRQ